VKWWYIGTSVLEEPVASIFRVQALWNKKMVIDIGKGVVGLGL